jgi:excisionase family DNA binding protein
MTVTVDVLLNGVRVPVELDDDAIAAIAAAVAPQPDAVEPSPYLTIVEAAEYLRCSRQRVDDLLSSCWLMRHKDGSRTLVSRAELDGYLSR